MSPELGQILRSLGSIEGKIGLVLANQDQLRDDHRRLHDDHENTKDAVSAVKSRLNWYTGAFVTAGVGLGLFKDRLIELIQGG
jgi:hypothetical protein